MKTVTMNPMYLMYLFGGRGYIKKYFFDIGGYLGVILGSSRYIGQVLAVFGLIFITIILYMMYQMYMDEPLSRNKREIVLHDFCVWLDCPHDEPCKKSKVHRGSFGSLRMEIGDE